MTEAERSLLLAVAGTLRDRLYQGAHYDSAAGSHALSVALTELRDEAPADPARVQAQLDALATAIDRILTKLLAHVPTLVEQTVYRISEDLRKIVQPVLESSKSDEAPAPAASDGRVLDDVTRTSPWWGDRPMTFVSLPIFWTRVSDGDFMLFAGPFSVGEIYLDEDGRWRSSLTDSREHPIHLSKEAARDALLTWVRRAPTRVAGYTREACDV